MTLALLAAVVAGALIGLSLGALGGGGSILAVPVLLALGQTATQATTGSLVVVGVTSLAGAVTAYRAGNVLLGAWRHVRSRRHRRCRRRRHSASAAVPEAVLLAAFAGLTLVVACQMAVRQLRQLPRTPAGTRADRPRLDDPIITFSPTFMCQCPRALRCSSPPQPWDCSPGSSASAAGSSSSPLSPVLALALPVGYAAGTSLVVITITSTAALATRAGTGTAPDWWLVATLTITAVAHSVAGARIAARTDTARLSAAFTAMVLLVAAYTAAHCRPGPHLISPSPDRNESAP